MEAAAMAMEECWHRLIPGEMFRLSVSSRSMSTALVPFVISPRAQRNARLRCGLRIVRTRNIRFIGIIFDLWHRDIYPWDILAGDDGRQDAPELLEDHIITIPGILRTRLEHESTSGVVDELHTYDPSDDERWGFAHWDVPFTRGRIY